MFLFLGCLVLGVAAFINKKHLVSGSAKYYTTKQKANLFLFSNSIIIIIAQQPSGLEFQSLTTDSAE